MSQYHTDATHTEGSEKKKYVLYLALNCRTSQKLCPCGLFFISTEACPRSTLRVHILNSHINEFCHINEFATLLAPIESQGCSAFFCYRICQYSEYFTVFNIAPLVTSDATCVLCTAETV